MNHVAAIFLAAAAALPAFSACRFSPAETQIYRRATDPQAPLAARTEAFKKSIQSCPNEPNLYVAFSSLLIANRDFKNALPWIDRGLGLAPRDTILNLRKGEALIALGQAKDGLQALDKTPVDAESQFFRGLGHQSLGEHQQARICFLDAWKQGREDPFVLYSLVREDEQLGDKPAGLEHFTLLLNRFPDCAWLHVLLGDAHFQKSEEAQAGQEYLEAVKLMPDLFEANFRLAYLAFEAGQNASAIKYYRLALAAKPHYIEANVYLGEALRRERRFPEAIEQLRHAIDMDPKSVLAYDSLAKALADAGRLPEAAAVLSTASNIFPDNSSFPAMRARILTRLGHTTEARRDASRAAAIIARKNQKDSLLH